jgi:hypothetical protein
LNEPHWGQRPMNAAATRPHSWHTYLLWDLGMVPVLERSIHKSVQLKIKYNRIFVPIISGRI